MKPAPIPGSAMIGLTQPVQFIVPEPLLVQTSAISLALIADAYIGSPVR